MCNKMCLFRALGLAPQHSTLNKEQNYNKYMENISTLYIPHRNNDQQEEGTASMLWSCQWLQ